MYVETRRQRDTYLSGKWSPPYDRFRLFISFSCWILLQTFRFVAFLLIEQWTLWHNRWPMQYTKSRHSRNASKSLNTFLIITDDYCYALLFQTFLGYKNRNKTNCRHDEIRQWKSFCKYINSAVTTHAHCAHILFIHFMWNFLFWIIHDSFMDCEIFLFWIILELACFSPLLCQRSNALLVHPHDESKSIKQFTMLPSSIVFSPSWGSIDWMSAILTTHYYYYSHLPFNFDSELRLER